MSETCPKCGGKVALGSSTINEIEPDQEPFEADVEESIDPVQLGPPQLIYMNVCIDCGYLVDYWAREWAMNENRELSSRAENRWERLVHSANRFRKFLELHAPQSALELEIEIMQAHAWAAIQAEEEAAIAAGEAKT